MPLQTTFGRKVTDTDTSQLFPLNTMRIEGSCIYKYVKANEAIDQYDAVASTAVGTVADAFASGQNVAGVALSAIASGAYGWIQVYGPLNATLSGSAGDKVYGTAGTGALTTTSTSNSAALGHLEAANNIMINCM